MVERVSTVLIHPLYPAPMCGLKAEPVFMGEGVNVPVSAGSLE